MLRSKSVASRAMIGRRVLIAGTRDRIKTMAKAVFICRSRVGPAECASTPTIGPRVYGTARSSYDTGPWDL